MDTKGREMGKQEKKETAKKNGKCVSLPSIIIS
jgi:hypothetical protein